jgi:hypothetical protein
MERTFYPPIHSVTFGISPQVRESMGYTMGASVGPKFPNLRVGLIELVGEDTYPNTEINTVIIIWTHQEGENHLMPFRKFINLPASIVYDQNKNKA